MFNRPAPLAPAARAAALLLGPAALWVLVLACAEPATVAPSARVSGAPVTPPLDRHPCGARTHFLTELPTPLSGVRGFVPLGNLSPPAHTLPTHHMYVYAVLTDPADPASPPREIPVYAPGRLVVVAVEKATPGGVDDYALHLKPCAQVRFYLVHLTRLAPDLAARIGDVGTGACFADFCAKRVSVPVAPGELLGTAGGPGFLAFDLGVVDERRGPLPFANPDRYTLSEDVLNALPPELRDLAHLIAPRRLRQFCALEYFTPPLRTALAALLGSFDGSVPRTVEPRCGEHMQDRVGTAQGNWFRDADDNAFFDEGTALALVHDHVDPEVPVFSISTSIPGWTPEVRFVSPVNSTGFLNRDFADVGPGSVYCYENLRTREGLEPGIVIVEVFASGGGLADRLRIERLAATSSCGPGSWTFSPGTVVFQR